MRSFGRKWQCTLAETGQSMQEVAEHVAMGRVGSGNAIIFSPFLIILFAPPSVNFAGQLLGLVAAGHSGAV